MKYLPLLALTASIFTSSGYAQDATKSEKPKTKLESFVIQDGIVIIRGFSTIGTVKGEYDSSVSVDSKEFTNPSSGRKEYGITFEVKESGRIERENTSYIDFDEIESLLKGLDFISKVDKSATKLDDFQADYKTRGDLKLSTFSTSGGATFLAIKSGTIGSATAYFNITKIGQIRELVVKAKQKLDSIKQPQSTTSSVSR